MDSGCEIGEDRDVVKERLFGECEKGKYLERLIVPILGEVRNGFCSQDGLKLNEIQDRTGGRLSGYRQPARIMKFAAGVVKA